MRSVTLHHEAEIELWHAVDYYEEIATGLGLDLEKEVRQAIARMRKKPYYWRERVLKAN